MQQICLWTLLRHVIQASVVADFNMKCYSLLTVRCPIVFTRDISTVLSAYYLFYKRSAVLSAYYLFYNRSAVLSAYYLFYKRSAVLSAYYLFYKRSAVLSAYYMFCKRSAVLSAYYLFNKVLSQGKTLRCLAYIHGSPQLLLLVYIQFFIDFCFSYFPCSCFS